MKNLFSWSIRLELFLQLKRLITFLTCELLLCEDLLLLLKGEVVGVGGRRRGRGRRRRRAVRAAGASGSTVLVLLLLLLGRVGKGQSVTPIHLLQIETGKKIPLITGNDLSAGGRKISYFSRPLYFFLFCSFFPGHKTLFSNQEKVNEKNWLSYRVERKKRKQFSESRNGKNLRPK